MQANTRRKENDIIAKMREEIQNKFESTLREIKTSKRASTVTNPGSDTNDTQNLQPSGSKGKMSMGVHTSNTIDSDLDEDHHSLRASNMNELRNPAKLFCKFELDLNESIVSNDYSEEEDYHKC